MTPIRDGDVADGAGENPAAEGTLGKLIELEEQIEVQVAQAKAEAERVVAEARQSARAAKEDGTASLDAKVAFARQLRDFEATRSVEVPEDQRQFHLCQAMWSSKYDLDGARAPGVNDAYLLAPKE